MPYKPPICPAYAQSQCLTLSPIPEAKSKVNSPVLSCKSSLFSCFEWSSASAIAPLMSQPHSCENASFSSCATSPAILDRLEQLNLQQQQQQQFASGSMPGISSILEQPTPFAVSLNANLGVGLGFTFLSPSSNGNTATTPFNTPDRPLAPKAIVTQFDPALIQMKLDSLSIPPLTPPYDEDLDTKEETDDNTPLHLWLQYRMEEAKQREEYEKESSDVLMSATPDSITKTLTKQVTKADGIALDSSPMKSTSSSHVQEDSEEEKDDEDVEQGQEDVIIVTHGKRISVQESCAIATLKRRSRLMGLYKEAGDIVDNDGLPADIEADEFGMKVDADTKLAETVQPDANEAEIAMNEDRSSPKYSIFSPTSRLPARRSVSFAKPEVTQVTTYASSPLASSNTNKKTHKRKASASSLFNVSPSEGLPRQGTIPIIPRSSRSFSTSAVSINSVGSNNSITYPSLVGRYKRARRSSSIVSSLAFTSNSLAPIFSSAFLKNSMNDKGEGDEVNIASLRSAMGTTECLTMETVEDDKENETRDLRKISAIPTAATQGLNKKRSFGISMSLSFRGRTQ